MKHTMREIEEKVDKEREFRSGKAYVMKVENEEKSSEDVFENLKILEEIRERLVASLAEKHVFLADDIFNHRYIVNILNPVPEDEDSGRVAVMKFWINRPSEVRFTYRDFERIVKSTEADDAIIHTDNEGYITGLELVYYEKKEDEEEQEAN